MIPHDPQAEQDLIGSMLKTEHARYLGLELSAADFWMPETRSAFIAIDELIAKGQPVNATTVASVAGLERFALLRWESDCPPADHTRGFVQIVAEKGSARRALTLADELRNAALASDVETIERLALEAGGRIAPPTMTPKPAMEASVRAARKRVRDWKIPGLLEALEVVMILGPEGFGKSELIYQFAVMSASGIHPWERHDIAPLRVLYLDLENPEGQIDERLRRLLGIAGEKYRGHLFVESRLQGMDLTSRRDVRWLDGLCGLHRPDLLVIAPLYKAYRAAESRSKSGEESAELVAAAIDELKVRHNLAVLLENHAGHGDSNDRNNWRPTGSSLWMRWPAFGFGLKPVSLVPREAEVKRFRGDRETGRGWPRRIAEGHRWPWEAVESKELT